jgi:MFS superfamily sulfate permease-like transporter
MFIYAFRLEKFCILIPLSVLEGFSFGVALTIGGVEINSAFGLKNLTKHDEIYMNIYESLKNV